MLALLSPAKSLDYERPLPGFEPSRPRFAEEADGLAAAASKLSAKKLSGLFAFNGDVYLGFEARSLDEPAIAFAQDHVRILSGLYGLLRPLDAIRPYRLEMGTKWAPGRAKDLYGWWGRRISDALAGDLAVEGSGTIINLASKEYWHAVEPHPPAGARIISIDFRENGPKGLYFNSFGAKRARGMMARWICEHRIDAPEGLKGFDSDGYRFEPEGSSEAMWRFVRGRD
jgi:cytoplasmic iron level regulating protein YaaA (DUF328/UPF0246 family)